MNLKKLKKTVKQPMFHKNYAKKEKKDKIKEIIIKVNPLTNNRAIKVQEGKRKITKREKQ